ncbi:MAG: hypothetical protein AAGC67_17265 [Myxococcota bacterium]
MSLRDRVAVFARRSMPPTHGLAAPEIERRPIRPDDAGERR